jgi:hypothetical protein
MEPDQHGTIISWSTACLHLSGSLCIVQGATVDDGPLGLSRAELRAVQEALKELCGGEDASEFEPSDVRRLYENGYKNTRRLKAATREGLEKCLPSALVDIVITARGECVFGGEREQPSPALC